MIQISFTRDYHTPLFTWYDEDETKPDEYPLHFRGYEYLTDEEALQMLDDQYVTNQTKEALKKILLY
jgi:hypothetical protein